MPIGDGSDGPLGPAGVVVGDDQAVEELAPGRDPRERVTDPAGPDQENAHVPNLARTHDLTTDLGEVLPRHDELSTFLRQRRGKPQRKVVGMAEARAATEPVAGKGLEKGALGLRGNVTIGLASTTPAYSLAATLGYGVRRHRRRVRDRRRHAGAGRAA